MLAGLCAVMINIPIYGQVDTRLVAGHKLPLVTYLSLVSQANLAFAAEKYNVNIAEAGIESAKVLPDPSLTVNGYDNQQATKHLGHGINIGLSKTIELGGKRKARVELAKGQTELSKAMLQDFFRNLQADAAISYYNSIQYQLLLQVEQNSYTTIKRLADADSIRYKIGAINEIDARQSKLEANSFLNTIIQREADWRSSLLQMAQYITLSRKDSVVVPMGDFEGLNRTFDLVQLIDQAQELRADLVAAKQNKLVVDQSYKLAKANRVIDMGITGSLQFSGASTNEIAPTPAYKPLNIAVSIPLKFSNIYKGDIKAAQFTIDQAKVQVEEIRLQISTEINQAYLNYLAAKKQTDQYRKGMLSDAGKILEGKIYSYKRGETSLLEVLNAQRTFNDVQHDYYQALFNYASSLINLERVSGIWDIK